MKKLLQAVVVFTFSLPGITWAAQDIDLDLPCITVAAYLGNEHLFSDQASAFFEGVVNTFVAEAPEEQEMELLWAFLDTCILGPDKSITEVIPEARAKLASEN